MMAAHQGMFIASPEYNASVTPLLKNTLDWISRVRERGTSRRSRLTRTARSRIGGASNGNYGAMRSLMALRQVLELGCGALVIPEQIAVVQRRDAFDEMDNFKDERAAATLRRVVQRLIEIARDDDVIGCRQRDRLIVALDLPSVAAAEALVEQLGDAVSFYKIGYQLAFAGGLAFARDAGRARTRRCSSISSCTTSATPSARASRASPSWARPSSPCTPIRRP